MGKYILKRLGQTIIVLVLVTLFVCVLMHLLPGDPVTIYLGDTATEESRAYYTELFGLDKPVYIQYLKWIGGLFKGEMGKSIVYSKDVSELIFPKLGTTLSVVVPAIIFSTIIGLILGTIAAMHRGGKLDSMITSCANVGIAMPAFWIGMVLVFFLAMKLKWLPVQGYKSPFEDFGGYLRRLVMPLIVLSLGQIASMTRQARSSVLEVMSSDFVRTAKSKGLKQRTVTYKHILRNALIPIVTMLGGSIGAMIGGTVVIESLFVIPGMGSLLLTAITNQDYLVVQNGVLIIAAFVLICNLIVDLLYGVIDPRIRVNE